MMIWRRVAGALCLMAGLSAGAATSLAQATTPGQPDMETQTFGSWTMRCVAKGTAGPVCDIVQGVTNRETGKQIMQVSFAYIAEKDKYAVQVVLPLGFLIPPGVLVRIDGAPDITDWPVTRCEPQGCLIEHLMDAEVLKPFRTKDKGTVIVLGAQGKPLGFPMSFNGFSAASDAMTARNKAAGKGK
ncbi:MAG: invasion associated locus B family protein [Zavarzinia sp.]|nr:invasion associated locus B family protein [Zavarzinia sp.]